MGRREDQAGGVGGEEAEAARLRELDEVMAYLDCRICRHPKGQYKVKYIREHEARCEMNRQKIEQERALEAQRRPQARVRGDGPTELSATVTRDWMSSFGSMLNLFMPVSAAAKLRK